MSGMLSALDPGWFHNVFNITIELDNATKVIDDGEMFALPWFSYNGTALFVPITDFALRGRIKLTTHFNRQVWHYGVVVMNISDHFVI